MKNTYKVNEEAVKKIAERVYDNGSTVINKNDLEEMFPELKESEDEKIRKALIEFVKSRLAGFPQREKFIAWLEKQGEPTYLLDNSESNVKFPFKAKVKLNGKIVTIQGGQLSMDCRKYVKYVSNTEDGYKVYKPEDLELVCNVEQKPFDKTEPKFHEGDWVVYECGEETATLQITRIVGGTYVFSDDSTLGVVDEDTLRLWTIQDAKDGDVLTCYSDIKGQPIEQTGIIKQYVGRHGGCSNSFKAHFGVDWDNNVVIKGYMGSSNISPATKEQRDTLMKAMADAGYIFDFEKKELKKVKQKPTTQIKSVEESLGIDSETYNKIVDECIYGEQKHAEWSDEDEVKINRIVACLENLNVADNDILLKDVDWLKSLKPQKQWKPSDEQMDALDDFIYAKYPNTEKYGVAVKSLYQDLKKLKEE